MKGNTLLGGCTITTPFQITEEPPLPMATLAQQAEFCYPTRQSFNVLVKGKTVIMPL